MSDRDSIVPSASSARSTNTFLSHAYLSSLPGSSVNDLQSFLDAQASLEEEAREAMPFETGECSYDKGYVKQSVWACKDCRGKGVCYGCSISCHAEHDLVELFHRRNFRCDCPTAGPSTTSLAPKSADKPLNPQCTLQPTSDPLLFPLNDQNRYTRNFEGKFCRCVKGETYDPMEEDESMIACLSCEDWFHEGCLNLYDPSKPPPVQTDDDDDESTPNPPEPAANGTMAITPKREENPIILPPDKYAHLVCGECVKKSVLLKRMAGTPGWLMVVPKENAGSQTSWSDQWEVLGQPVEKAGIITVEFESDANIGEKRKAGDIAGEIDSKKARLDSEGYIASTVILVDNPCLLPTPVSRVQAIWQSESDSRAKGDVFLVEGEREKLKALLACGCTDCTGMQQSGLPVPFPLSEEDEGEVYEPPQENASEAPSQSIDEMTSKAFDTLPKSQAIETMIKFNEMKDKLKSFLEGFRGGDRVVREEDIRGFVDNLKEQSQAGSR